MTSFSEQIQSMVSLFLEANTSIIIAHVVSSVSVMIFIVYFFWKPTSKFIMGQREKLDKVHSELSQATKETKQALINLKKEQKSFVEERQKFLSERKEKEKLILEERMKEAEKSKQEIIDQANQRVKLLEDEARKTVNQKIISLSVELAEKLIKGTINKKTQSKIIDGYLEELDDLFKGENHEDESFVNSIKKS